MTNQQKKNQINYKEILKKTSKKPSIYILLTIIGVIEIIFDT